MNSIKCLAKFSAIILVFLCSITSQGDENLISNPSFEDGLSGWSAKLDASLSTTNDALHEDTALQVITSGISNYEGMRSSPYAVDSGFIYIASAYVKGSGTVKICFYSGTSGWTYGEEVALTSEWRKINVSKYVENNENIDVQVLTWNGIQATTFKVDMVELVKEDDYKMAYNDSFESDLTGWGPARPNDVPYSTLATSYDSADGDQSLYITTPGNNYYEGTRSTVRYSVKNGKTYTASAYVKGSGNVKICLYGTEGGWTYADEETTLSSTEWKKISVTKTITNDDELLNIYIFTWGSPQAVSFKVDKVELDYFKPVLYWRGDLICKTADPDDTAAEVKERGFTHVLVSQYDVYGTYTPYLDGKGFTVIKNIMPTSWHLDYAATPRYFSPYNEWNDYTTELGELEDYLDDYPEISGIIDDFEQLPFPTINYTADGTSYPGAHEFTDLQERIGNEPPDAGCDWPVFKNWPTSGYHDIAFDYDKDGDIDDDDKMTMEAIEYNFPSLSVDNSGTPYSIGIIIGYYGTGFTYQSYEMAAQTFKPTDPRITRVDVMLKRYGSAYPLGNLYYYLTEVDANGKPDLSQKISHSYCTINAFEVNKNETDWEVLPLSLYFDPVDVGELDTNKQYAIVLEFTKKNNDDWNNAYYRIAGFNTNNYSDGQAWRLNNGSWISYPNVYDLWFKTYKPNPPAGFALNQIHEDWIDFQCEVMTRFVEDYRDVADSVSPARDVWIYSGYTGHIYARNTHSYKGFIRSNYSVDWELLSATGINFAVCGFGSKTITATRAALNAGHPSNPPKLIGVGYTPYGEASFQERYDTCDGADLFYLGSSYDDDPGWSLP